MNKPIRKTLKRGTGRKNATLGRNTPQRSSGNPITEAIKRSLSAEEIKDWLFSFVVAASVYFIILPLILNTSTPAVVVSSCSEFPYLNIGDIIVVKGSNISEINAPLVEIDTYNGLTQLSNNRSQSTFQIGNQAISASPQNDIVVYSAYPSRNEVIHRALVRVQTNSGELLLTKGDANNLPDQMTKQLQSCIDENIGCISTPVTQETLRGKHVMTLPLLGHVKLFFCDIMPFCDGHANIGTGFEYKLYC
ncbi:MAG: hypothetical protein J4432_04545 [DPANN group archaeon]|nr:hypothetical protein [DPANN group archaeon]